MELIDYSNIIRRIKELGCVREWSEYKVSDPFRFSLNKFELDSDGMLVESKIFIKRDDSSEDRMKNVIKSYRPEEIKDILERKGFMVDIYDISKLEYDSQYENAETAYRVVARKQK